MSLSSVLDRAFCFYSCAKRNKEKSPTANSKSATNPMNELIDALIIAGLNFFTTLSALGATQITHSTKESLLTASISAGLGFFSTLALKRGIKK